MVGQALLGQGAPRGAGVQTPHPPHHKELNRGDFLIDDRTGNGADVFEGEHIRFGMEKFPDWPAVMAYLRPRVLRKKP